MGGLDEVYQAVPVAQPTDEARNHVAGQAVPPAHLLARNLRMKHRGIDGVMHDRDLSLRHAQFDQVPLQGSRDGDRVTAV